MHVPINVKSPNNTSKWQMGFNSVFKGLIINYGIIIKNISTLMYTVWHVDKYKITFKLLINHWTNEIL